MKTAAALQLDYLPLDQLAGRPTSWWESVLGVVGFAAPPKIDQHHIPVTASGTPALGTADAACEVWRVAGTAAALTNTAVDCGRVRYRYCDRFLFGCITIEEQDVPGDPGAGGAALRHATETAYRDIFEVLRNTGHGHLIRVWNYLPDINGESGGDERYRHFNSARRWAFKSSGRATAGSVPAASALGSAAGSPVSIYFLAARDTPVMLENPRQVSAYHYPPQYGRHSPVFSRACVLNETSGTNLFVSGTASIRGHETIHRGDVIAQTRETLVNIAALVEEANRLVGAARYALEALKYKVYVRQPEDLAAIEAELAASLAAATPIVYLQADVCREDLLVEIEATGESTGIGPMMGKSSRLVDDE